MNDPRAAPIAARALDKDFNGDHRHALTKTLQDYVKNTVAPYKYPRAIEYVANLPRTQTGKARRLIDERPKQV